MIQDRTKQIWQAVILIVHVNLTFGKYCRLHIHLDMCLKSKRTSAQQAIFDDSVIQ